MFVYCLNSPVNGCDPCGTCFHRWDFWNDCEKCGGKSIGDKWNNSVAWLTNTCSAVKNYVTNDDISTAKSNLIKDGFTFYKGTPIIRANILGTGGVSFGIVFMGGDNLNAADFGDTLNHEYGHAVHFRQLGAKNYFCLVAIPSLAAASVACIFPNVNEYYYNFQTERIADQLGDVNRGYLPGADTVGSLFWLWTVYISRIS
jgi:hypothetical protein